MNKTGFVIRFPVASAKANKLNVGNHARGTADLRQKLEVLPLESL